MKKFITLFILFNFLGINCIFAHDLKDMPDKNLKIQNITLPYYEDELVKDTLDPNLKIKKAEIEYIEDTLAKNTLNRNLKIKKYKYEPITDDTIPFVFNRPTYYIGDRNQKFDFENLATNIIKITPTKYYTTKHNLNEGEYVEFRLADDIKIKSKTYKKGELIKARVENVTKNSAYGLPSEVILDNFVLANNVNIDTQLVKRGANRAGWVYPCGYILTGFFGIGLLFFPIRGGHAKFKPNKVYEIETQAF